MRLAQPLQQQQRGELCRRARGSSLLHNARSADGRSAHLAARARENAPSRPSAPRAFRARRRRLPSCCSVGGPLRADLVYHPVAARAKPGETMMKRSSPAAVSLHAVLAGRSASNRAILAMPLTPDQPLVAVFPSAGLGRVGFDEPVARSERAPPELHFARERARVGSGVARVALD